MIRVEMVLNPFSGGANKLLCVVEIVNDGTVQTPRRGNYTVRLKDQRGRLIRQAHVENYPRLAYPAWRLLVRAMNALELR